MRQEAYVAHLEHFKTHGIVSYDEANFMGFFVEQENYVGTYFEVLFCFGYVICLRRFSAIRRYGGEWFLKISRTDILS